MSDRRAGWVIANDLISAFDPDTGEIDGEAWDAYEAELADKAEAIHAVCAHWMADAEVCKAEAKRLTERAKKTVARAKGLNAKLLGYMEAAGVAKLSGPTLTASIRKGSQRVIANIDALPPEWVRETTVRTPDLSGMKPVLVSGGLIDGAFLEIGPNTVGFR